ncbi:MAG: hypothetical protein LBQ21_05080 [Clostridiales Family XIII bacterium]|nr:hypothetical protein [Clostridiales Family XIII bacterium]
MKYDKAVYNKYYGYIYIRWAIICAVSSVIVYAMFISAYLFGFTYPKYFLPIGLIAFVGPVGLLWSLSWYKGKKNYAQMQVQDIRENVFFGDIVTKWGWEGNIIGTYDYGTTYTCTDITNIAWTRRYIILYGNVYVKKREKVHFGNRTGGEEIDSVDNCIKIPRIFIGAERLMTLVGTLSTGYFPDSAAWAELRSRVERVHDRRGRQIKKVIIIAPIAVIVFTLLIVFISMSHYR